MKGGGANQCVIRLNEKGGDNVISLEQALKMRLEEERISAEKRFIELDLLYSNSVKCSIGSEEYMQYLKNERDIAYMLLQLKKRDCDNIKKILKALSK